MNRCFLELPLVDGFHGQMSLGNYSPFLEIKKKKKHINISNALKSPAVNILDCLVH